MGKKTTKKQKKSKKEETNSNKNADNKNDTHNINTTINKNDDNKFDINTTQKSAESGIFENSEFFDIFQKEHGFPPCFSTLSRIVRYRKKGKGFVNNSKEYAMIMDGKI